MQQRLLMSRQGSCLSFGGTLSFGQRAFSEREEAAVDPCLPPRKMMMPNFVDKSAPPDGVSPTFSFQNPAMHCEHSYDDQLYLNLYSFIFISIYSEKVNITKISP